MSAMFSVEQKQYNKPTQNVIHGFMNLHLCVSLSGKMIPLPWDTSGKDTIKSS